MSKPVAVVTGAASGIGLALTKHLISRGYLVAMADYNKAEGEKQSAELGPNTLFKHTDVSSYTDQAALFKTAFEWGGGRLDVLCSNAGIDDTQSLYGTGSSVEEGGAPEPLDLKTIRVNLDAPIWGVWLFKHFARQNAVPGGKVIITSSAAGFYPMATNPVYTASKHGVVGFTRACGSDSPLAKENITVNCICPAFVVTNLCPPHMLERFPKEHITPMSTVTKALDRFLENGSMTGQCVELSLGELYHREEIECPNESQRWLREEAKAFWEDAYS